MACEPFDYDPELLAEAIAYINRMKKVIASLEELYGLTPKIGD